MIERALVVVNGWTRAEMRPCLIRINPETLKLDFYGGLPAPILSLGILLWGEIAKSIEGTQRNIFYAGRDFNVTDAWSGNGGMPPANCVILMKGLSRLEFHRQDECVLAMSFEDALAIHQFLREPVTA